MNAAENITADQLPAADGGGVEILDDMLGLVVHHHAERAHRGRDGCDGYQSRHQPAVYQLARVGHDILHVGGHVVAQKQGVQADDNQGGEQGIEHRGFIPEKDQQIALGKILHSRSSFPVMPRNASSIDPTVTSNPLRCSRQVSIRGRDSKESCSGTIRLSADLRVKLAFCAFRYRP